MYPIAKLSSLAYSADSVEVFDKIPKTCSGGGISEALFVSEERALERVSELA